MVRQSLNYSLDSLSFSSRILYAFKIHAVDKITSCTLSPEAVCLIELNLFKVNTYWVLSPSMATGQQFHGKPAQAPCLHNLFRRSI